MLESLAHSWMDIGLYALALLVVVGGFLGTMVPILPGLPMIAVGALVAALPNDFHIVGVWTIAVFVILALVGMVLDLVGHALGAKRVRASAWAMWGSVLGALFGFFVWQVIGMLIFPFVGAVVGEYLATRNLAQAGRVGWATWLGMLITAAVKISLGLGMLLWLLFLFGWHASS